MHSFEVNIRICQTENSDFHRGKHHFRGLTYPDINLKRMHLLVCYMTLSLFSCFIKFFHIYDILTYSSKCLFDSDGISVFCGDWLSGSTRGGSGLCGSSIFCGASNRLSSGVFSCSRLSAFFSFSFL